MIVNLAVFFVVNTNMIALSLIALRSRLCFLHRENVALKSRPPQDCDRSASTL